MQQASTKINALPRIDFSVTFDHQRLIKRPIV